MQKHIEKLKVKTHNFLRWSEQYTKTDMVYLAKGGFWLTFGHVISSISAFLLAVAFANLLPREIYGTYKYVISIAGILTILTLRGMNLAIFHAVARGFEGVFLKAFKTQIKWGILSSMASISIGFYYFFNANNTLAISFWIIAIFLSLMDPLGIYQSFLQGKKLFNLSAIYGSLSQIISITILITVVFFTNNIFILLFAYFASWTLIRLSFFVIAVKKFPPNNNIDPKTIEYGKRTSFVKILDSLVSSVDSILIFHYLGAINLAIYSFAIAPTSQLKGLTGHLSTLAMPKLANRASSEINHILKKRIIYLFFLGLFISLIYILTAPYIYQIFFPKYLDSVFFSQVFSLMIAIYLPQAIFGAALSAKLTLIPPKMLYLWNLPGIIFIIFALIFVVKLGILGVILGRLLASASNFVINLIVWKKILRNESSIKTY